MSSTILVPEMFCINAPLIDYGNFKYGNIANANRYDYFKQDNELLFQIQVEIDKQPLFEPKVGDMSFYNINGHIGTDVIRRKRPFLFKKNGYFDLESLFGERIKISLTASYLNMALKRISKMRSLGVELTDIVTLRLLHENKLSFHGGTFTYGGGAHIITGLPDTGKTLSTMSLIDEDGVGYMSEDIIVIDENCFAYAVPFTQTVEKRKNLSCFQKVTGRVYESWYKNNYIKSDVIEVMPEVGERIEKKNKVETIFFLTKGESDSINTIEEKSSILNDLIRLNNLEFTYWRNEFILSYLYFNSKEVISSYLLQEADLIRNLVESSKVVQLSSPNPFNFAPMIKEYLSLNS